MMTYGPGGYPVGFRAQSELFGALAKDENATKLKISNHFSQECRFLDRRFDEADLETGYCDLEREAGKSSACANVGEPTTGNRDRASGKHALSKVALEGLADAGDTRQADLRIP